VVTSLFLIAIWGVALWMPGLRTVKFLALLVIASVILIAIQFLPTGTREPMSVLVAVAIGGMFWFADRLGLSPLDGVERAVDRRLAQAWQLGTSAEHEQVVAAIRVLDDLLQEEHPQLDGRWRAVMRILRRAWARTVEAEPVPFTSRTTSKSFKIASRRYFSDMRMRRTLFWRDRVEPIDGPDDDSQWSLFGEEGE
jgi:hypothetical protein